MSQVITMRLPDATADEVRRIAQRERRSLSDVSAWMIEEWVRQNQFAHIEFRSFHGERQACIKGRLQVWQTIQVAKAYSMDVAKTAAHLELQPEQVQFIDNRTIAHNDLGGQIAALIWQWEEAKEWVWTNTVLFLRPKPD